MRSSSIANIASSCSKNVNADNRSKGLVKGKGSGSGRPTNAQVIRHQASVFKRKRESLHDETSDDDFEMGPPSNIIHQQSTLHPLVGDGLKAFGWEPGAILHLEYLPNNVKYVAQVIRYATYNCFNYK